MLLSPLQSIRPPLLAFRLFESRNIEDTRDRIAAILQEHRLHPGKAKREVRSHMDFLGLETIGIGTLRYGCPMFVDVTGLDDYHVLIFCLSGSGVVRSGDREAAVNSRWGFQATAGEAFRARFSGDCEQLVVRLRHDCLPRLSRSARQHASIDLSDGRNCGWIEALLSLAHNSDDARPGAVARSRLEQSFIDTFLDSRSELPQAGRAAHHVSPFSVYKAERFIAANYPHPITLADIASAAGVSERTLLLAFNRFRSTTPMVFLRNFRLDRTRERLISEAQAGAISAAARACGVAHLGRFSRDYAVRFGEPPSATIRSAAR